MTLRDRTGYSRLFGQIYPSVKIKKKPHILIKEKEEMNLKDLDRITFDRHIMAGKACIRGMRIPVSLILNLVANGKPHEEILEEYPDLELEDIRQSLLYASWLAEEEVYTIEQQLSKIG